MWVKLGKHATLRFNQGSPDFSRILRFPIFSPNFPNLEIWHFLSEGARKPPARSRSLLKSPGGAENVEKYKENPENSENKSPPPSYSPRGVAGPLEFSLRKSRKLGKKIGNLLFRRAPGVFVGPQVILDASCTFPSTAVGPGAPPSPAGPSNSP